MLQWLSKFKDMASPGYKIAIWVYRALTIPQNSCHQVSRKISTIYMIMQQIAAVSICLPSGRSVHEGEG